jgi:cell wall-associated NlpC family hydrolase
MRDPRVTAARPDLAAKHLEGHVTAARYIDGVEHVVAKGVVPVHQAPSPAALLDTQALKGERVTIYDRKDGWAWGQLKNDAYVGWLPEDALGKPQKTATHKVTALRTFVFPEASIKSPPQDTLTLGARVVIVSMDDTFAVTDDGLYLPARHIGDLGAFEDDFVAVAERFLGTPYLWGGKTSLGIDCSALVQMSLAATGIEAPRDSDMQQAGIGQALDPTQQQNLKRGDLIFWKGHVAIARDARTIVHANAFHMATAIEETSVAIERIKASGSGVLAIKRLE